MWERAATDIGVGETFLGVSDFCEQVKELCDQSELDMAEVLSALTLAICDLAMIGPHRVVQVEC